MVETIVGLVKVAVLAWTVVFAAVSIGSAATSWSMGVLRFKEIALIAFYVAPAFLIPVTGGYAWAAAALSLWALALGGMPSPPELTPLDQESPDVQPNPTVKNIVALAFTVYFALQARGAVRVPGRYIWESFALS
jgi:hypothetical protein